MNIYIYIHKINIYASCGPFQGNPPGLRQCHGPTGRQTKMYSRGRFDQRNLAWVDEGHRWHGMRSPHTLGIPGVLPSIESWNPQTFNLAWGDELIMLGWTGWKCQFSAVPPPANMFLEGHFLLCSFTNISPVLLPMLTPHICH